MTIPFLAYFKKKEAKPAAAPAPARPARPKPDSARLSKTVMPNMTQTVGSQSESGSVATMVAPARTNARATVSFGGQNRASRLSGLPPAVALALEPRIERTISLELQDVVGQMPNGLVRPLENANAVRKVLLKASEVERGMAAGKPSVSVWTIFQQVPEIFLRKIPSDDTTEVGLPFDKVMQQFAKMQVRTDQSREQAVPHVETPFLKVTLEDDERFGTVTKIPQPGESDLPPVRMELATAETLAAAQPEATAGERFVVTPLPAMNFSLPPTENGTGHKGTAGNPISISAKGTGAPASERVPASSGPSVPSSGQARIPFKMSAPSEEARPKEPWLTKENFVGEAAPVSKEVKIELPLKSILQGVMLEQLKGDIASVPDDVRMEIPFYLIEPQLATGRISLPAAEFASYLPEAQRELFATDVVDAPVILPLQDVLKNLPGASLQVRPDQVEIELGETFETPFSARAEEDAKRFQVPATPVAKPNPPAPPIAPVESPKEEVKAVAPVAAAPAIVPAPSPAPAPAAVAQPAAAAPAAKPKPKSKAAKHAGEELDAKAAVAQAAGLRGVKGCAIMFGDGLSLAANMPAKYGVDGLCAMAPSFFRKVENHLTETTLGLLETLTIACPKESMTLFVHDNLCLAALHEKEALTAEIRDRLARVLLELSRKYSNPA